MAIPMLQVHGRVSRLARVLFILVFVAMANAGDPARAQGEREATTTTLASSANPAIQGQSVTFTARVKGANGVPTGAITFKDGNSFPGCRTPVGQRQRQACGFHPRRRPAHHHRGL